MTAAFNSLLAEHCPRTHSHQAEVLPSPSDIEAVTGSLLDEMEDLLLENAKIVGAKENRLNQIRYSLETGDPVEIYDDVLQISGRLPDPGGRGKSAVTGYVLNQIIVYDIFTQSPFSV